MSRPFRLLLMLGLATAASGCTVLVGTPKAWRPTPEQATAARATLRAGQEQSVKLHLRDGDLVILSDWDVEEGRQVRGHGMRYDPARVPRDTRSTEIRIPLDSIALLETVELEARVSVVRGIRHTWTALWIATTALAVALITSYTT